MLEAPDGSIYLTDLEHNAVVHWNPSTKSIEQVITDKRLMWPDTLSWGPNDELYVTTSQIENMPRFNNGKSTRTEPYKLWKITGVNRRYNAPATWSCQSGVPARNRFRETLEMEQENLPSARTFDKDSHRGTYRLQSLVCSDCPRRIGLLLTLVVMQSTLIATVLISIAATALGALAGALVASYFPGNVLVFAAAVFVLGLLCAEFRMERSAYRNAGVTFAIIMLIPRANAA